MATLTFLKLDRVIQVDSPQTEVTIQDLINQIRNWEDELLNMDYGIIANAFGKQSLGGGASVGITLELVNDWRIAFEARPGPTTVLCTVSGGNLVATNIYANNPIKATAFTQVVISQSSSPTIITPPEDLNMLYLIESLRGNHASLGNIWYWDPVNGNDANDGTQPGDAVATFAQAQTLATAGNHDVIFCLAKHSSGITTVTEKLNITKDTLKVRGPGFPFQLVPTTSGTPTVTINADSVEVSGLYIKTAGTGSDNGITVTGNDNLIKDCWINSARGHGIGVSASARTKIEKCAIESCLQNAINLGATSTFTNVSMCILTGCVDGVDLAGSGLTDNIFENNLVYNNSGWGIDIGSGVTRTGVRLHHTFSGNTSGSTRDLGSQTFIESQAGGASASEIADAVWDELISDHVTTGTTGKTLRDAKTKATLASLK